jgi:hypothetical protein
MKRRLPRNSINNDYRKKPINSNPRNYDNDGPDWEVYGTGTVDCKVGGRAAVLWQEPRRRC